MHRLLSPLLLSACGACSPGAPAIPTVRTARPLDTVAPASRLARGLTVLHTLTPADGIAVRGALTELDGRLYGLAGEAGPNGTPGCSSSASWHTIEHTAHCPGALFSLALDGPDFRVEHAFSQLDDHARNADGYHPYGTLAVGPDGRLYGVAQAGGRPPIRDGFVVPGYGTLFRYDPARGAFETLHSFFGEARALDGEYPMGAVAIARRLAVQAAVVVARRGLPVRRRHDRQRRRAVRDDVRHRAAVAVRAGRGQVAPPGKRAVSHAAARPSASGNRAIPVAPSSTSTSSRAGTGAVTAASTGAGTRAC